MVTHGACCHAREMRNKHKNGYGCPSSESKVPLKKARPKEGARGQRTINLGMSKIRGKQMALCFTYIVNTNEALAGPTHETANATIMTGEGENAVRKTKNLQNTSQNSSGGSCLQLLTAF